MNGARSILFSGQIKYGTVRHCVRHLFIHFFSPGAGQEKPMAILHVNRQLRVNGVNICCFHFDGQHEMC